MLNEAIEIFKNMWNAERHAMMPARAKRLYSIMDRVYWIWGVSLGFESALFPSWYRFAGKRTTGGIRLAGNSLEGIFDREVPKYTQIGNAVPVGLAEKVGQHFRAIIPIGIR